MLQLDYFMKHKEHLRFLLTVTRALKGDNISKEIGTDRDDTRALISRIPIGFHLDYLNLSVLYICTNVWHT